MQETIELLNECISNIEAGNLSIEQCLETHASNAEMTGLLQAYQAAQSGSSLQPTDTFKSASRARMLNEIKHITPAVTNSHLIRPIEQKQQKPAHRRSRMTWIAIAISALTLFFGGTTAAFAAESLPGDSLYPLKTGFQQLQLELSDDEGDVDLLLGFMEGNLGEIDQLMQQSRPEDMEEGLNQYNQHLSDLNETQNRINYDTSHPDDALTLRIQDQLMTQTKTMQQLCDQIQDEPVKLQLQQSIHNAENSAGYGPDESGPPDTTGEPGGNGPGEQQGDTLQIQVDKPDDAGPPEEQPQGTPQGPNGEPQGPGEPGNGQGDDGNQGSGGNK